eukprot:GHVN01028096.1.p1 GENE.GHVN01028096.1~~GHVN01028096.1.p1  ORF type:complete len:206 (-),score=42.36 GHVN01028096.1:1041-1658(-)
MTDESDSDYDSATILHLQAQHCATEEGGDEKSDGEANAEISSEKESELPPKKEENEGIKKGPSKQKVPSFEEAIATTTLTFRDFAQNDTAQDRAVLRLDRVPASSSLNPDDRPSNLDSQDAQAAMREFGLPDHSWHVPVPLTTIVSGRKKTVEEVEKNKQKREREKESQPTSRVKDKEKVKRQKGQSTHDSWKSETWMKLRQQFD